MSGWGTAPHDHHPPERRRVTSREEKGAFEHVEPSHVNDLHKKLQIALWRLNGYFVVWCCRQNRALLMTRVVRATGKKRRRRICPCIPQWPVRCALIEGMSGFLCSSDFRGHARLKSRSPEDLTGGGLSARIGEGFHR